MHRPLTGADYPVNDRQRGLSPPCKKRLSTISRGDYDVIRLIRKPLLKQQHRRSIKTSEITCRNNGV
jgi:hypothetical protein